MIALIDYGGGNVGSVLKAIQYLGGAAEVVDRPERLAAATKIILPGQGHFGAMMHALRARGLLEPLRRVVENSIGSRAAGTFVDRSARTKSFAGSAPAGPAREDKPFLGICLGLQALYESSEEAPEAPGLGALRGRVARFERVFKVPHVGWSQLEIPRQSRLLGGVAGGSFVYYCHSYYGPVTEESVALTDYGQRFAAAVETGNLWAVQFHPEKSGEVGLRVLKNFLDLK